MSQKYEYLEENERVLEEFKGYWDGLVSCRAEKYVLLASTAAMLERYKKMRVRAGDVWVVTYPKCGTTWTQEMVWQIVNKCDFERGKLPLFERFPFLEIDTLIKDRPLDILDNLEKQEGQRLIKTHLPLSLLPDNLLETGKVVYVARNPKDVLVSYYHHHKLVRGHDYTGDLPGFSKWFMKEQVSLKLLLITSIIVYSGDVQPILPSS